MVEVMEQLAGFMQDYKMRSQHGADRSMTRYKHDVSKMVENNEITTGPGRYALGVPNHYGNAVYAPNPTVRMQKWGASHDMSSTKTDVESDLWNIGRPSTRTVCGQYQPEDGARRLTAMPEGDFPQTAARLVDPPCTLRGSGWNRWEWLCENPQENVMTPFEHLVDSRHANKDRYYSALQAGGTVGVSQGLICGQIYVEPAVPVARTRGPNEPANFTDAVPGASQRPVTGHPPPAVYTARGGSQRGNDHPDGVPTGPVTNLLDRQFAESGVLAAPPPFSAFIAPH
jgi:hypothetical protein